MLQAAFASSLSISSSWCWQAPYLQSSTPVVSRAISRSFRLPPAIICWNVAFLATGLRLENLEFALRRTRRIWTSHVRPSTARHKRC